MSKANNLRVLLLDDDKFMLEFVSDLFIQLGVKEVLVAQDGKAGLSVLAAQVKHVDLLICDIEMPGMDGIEFLRNIANHGYSGKIVLFSGIDADLLRAAERLAKARGLNVIGTLTKPVTVGSLASILSQLSQPYQRHLGQEQTVLTFTQENLKQALRLNEIIVFYQPKISLISDQITGVECLARWDHPQYGIVAPDQFIPLIEQYGLINEFTLYIFRNAIQQLAEWQQQGFNKKIAINLSVSNLDRFDLPEIFEQIVSEEYKLTTDKVILEITESNLIKDFTLSLDILTRLRLKGFGLSIDDFGTGYATMETLKDLPFTELKIDRVFTNNAANDPSAHAIVESSIKLGKKFNLNIVAEGIEEKADKDLILKLGCDEIQGFYIAKPMPSDQFLEWFKQYSETQKSNKEEKSSD